MNHFIFLQRRQVTQALRNCTAFTEGKHYYCAYKHLPLDPTPTQISKSKHTLLRFILILSSHYHTGVPSGKSLKTFWLKLCKHFSSHISAMSHPSHHTSFYSYNTIHSEVRFTMLPFCNFPTSCYLPLLVPTSFTATYCLGDRRQVRFLHNTRGNTGYFCTT